MALVIYIGYGYTFSIQSNYVFEMTEFGNISAQQRSSRHFHR